MAFFFTKDEFYSSLKGKAVDEEEYNRSKLLYTLLKMRGMSDLNDLYNAQDINFLCEIFDNRFQAMFEKSGFNPKKLFIKLTLIMKILIMRDTSLPKF